MREWDQDTGRWEGVDVDSCLAQGWLVVCELIPSGMNVYWHLTSLMLTSPLPVLRAKPPLLALGTMGVRASGEAEH